MVNKIKFNISASSYSLFKESPLVFYYTYILKAPYDTAVNKVYGDAGTIVHNLIEEYNNDKSLDVFKVFEERWSNKKLGTEGGFKGEPLNKDDYINALKYGMKLVDKVYDIVDSELAVELPFYEGENSIIGIKGFIDCIAKNKKDEVLILDWKTNNSKSDFRTHALMYHFLYYKKFNVLPNKAVYEYLKLGSTTTYEFTIEDVINFEKELNNFCKFIDTNYNRIDKFETGNIDSPFNAHKQKCLQEMLKRNNKIPLNCGLKNNYLVFETMPDKLGKIMKMKYSYSKDGVFNSVAFKTGQWDGRKYFFKGNCLPYALIHDLEELISDYNFRFKTNYELKITDYRDKDVLNTKYNTAFKNSDIKLRYYQLDAVNMALVKEIGILALGCSSGKTIIAAELIKRMNRRTLFLVNRIELAEQTKDELENYLGVDVGLMTEGELVTDKQIIVASIQTIYAILKRKDESSKLLKTYLYNVSAIIADEIQGVKNSGYYKSIYSNAINIKYCIGLSGTPFRTQGDTLEMNSLIGFPIYWKSNEALTEEGFLCPSKCLFIKNFITHDDDDYMNAYDNYIVNNEKRNEIIAAIAKKYEDKKILILTRRIKHAEILKEMIPNSVIINGNTDKKYRKEQYENFKNNKGLVLIGSTKIFSAGINIPSLDIIINGTAHKSSIDSIQIVGRVKRKSEGKSMGYYIDFDDCGRFFKQASDERKDILKQFGETVKIVESLDEEIK
jgi:superfamily II DNA or RNA helicase